MWLVEISQFTWQNTTHLISQCHLCSCLIITGVNIAESNFHFICNSKAITVCSFNLN